VRTTYDGGIHIGRNDGTLWLTLVGRDGERVSLPLTDEEAIYIGRELERASGPKGDSDAT
jgi:hypothetical protein